MLQATLINFIKVFLGHFGSERVHLLDFIGDALHGVGVVQDLLVDVLLGYVAQIPPLGYGVLFELRSVLFGPCEASLISPVLFLFSTGHELW